MLIGARTSIAHWIYVLIAALLSAAVTLLLISVVETENNIASAQSTSSSGSAPSCDGGSISLNVYEMSTFELHSQTRESNNLPTLCVSETLTQAARSHSQEMIDKDYFSHNSYNGESSSTRLGSFGYNSYEQVGENLAWGSGSLASPENIFQGWMGSSGHRAATGECEGYSDCTIYTADFGVRQSSAPEEGADVPQETNTPQERTDTHQRDEITKDSNVTRLNLYQYILRLLHSLGF
jgi:hypothetical protein